MTPERLAALLTSTPVADDFFHLVFQDLAFADRTSVVGVYGSLTSFPNDPEMCVTLAVGNDLLPAGAGALEPLARILTQLVEAHYGCIEREVGWMLTSVPPPTVYDPIWERYRTRHPAVWPPCRCAIGATSFRAPGSPDQALTVSSHQGSPQLSRIGAVTWSMSGSRKPR